MKGMGKFDPVYYRHFRPFYPGETFAGLRDHLAEGGHHPPLVIADVGSGTGHSAISLLKTELSPMQAVVHALDPDPGMISEARNLAEAHELAGRLHFAVASGEHTGLRSESVHAVTVGSAFHWMDREAAREEFHRVLLTSGLVRIFEYQFPKTAQLPELNEWIRRQFNLVWKAPGQVPRGDFAQLTSVFRDDCRFRFTAEAKPPMHQPLSAADLAGLLFSQSRVLHFERTLSEPEKELFREETLERIRAWIPEGETALFDFRLAWVEYRKISPPG